MTATTIDATAATTHVTVDLPAELIDRLNTLAALFAADAQRPASTSALVAAAVEMLFDALGGDGYGEHHRFAHPGTAALAAFAGSTGSTNQPSPSTPKQQP